uniref:Reverse transcriptase domain-containing protein n=1 Tax=Strigamia maritima TaxID=126957 RepID=T1IHX6_STRMM
MDYVVKHLKALYRRKKKQKQLNIWDKVRKCKDASKFWSKVKKFSRGKRKMGLNISDSDWKTHFSNLLNGSDCKSTYLPPLGIEEFIFTGDEDLDADFSFAEFNNQIKRLKTKKAPGPDQLINEFLKGLTGDSRRRVLSWINKMWDERRWPDDWRDGTICPIYKAGDEKLPSNYRGITLLNGMYKIVTAMMARRISDWLEKNDKIKESQAGFGRGYSTRDHLFTLNSLIECRFREKKKLFALFLDFKVAFDSIDVIYGMTVVLKD